MKTYKLETFNGLYEELGIHHTKKDEMVFDNLKEAVLAFEKECESLKEHYQSFDDVDFEAEHVNASDLYGCQLRLLINGEHYDDVDDEDYHAEAKETMAIEEEYVSPWFFED